MVRSARLLGLALVYSLVCSASLPATAPTNDGSAEADARLTIDPSVASGLVEQLNTLVADPDSDRPRYDRELFSEGADLDEDCVRTRHEVLQEEATEFGTDAVGCKVVAGQWTDPFTGRRFTDPTQLQLDHVVALADAWRSGAWAWTDEDRKLFSNDPANLNVIASGENQRKSDSGPASYTPTNTKHTCSYVIQYGAAKAEWHLSITRADFVAITAVLADCTDPDTTNLPAQEKTR